MTWHTRPGNLATKEWVLTHPAFCLYPCPVGPHALSGEGRVVGRTGPGKAWCGHGPATRVRMVSPWLDSGAGSLLKSWFEQRKVKDDGGEASGTLWRQFGNRVTTIGPSNSTAR